MTAVNDRFNEAIARVFHADDGPWIWHLIGMERQRQDDLWGWPNNGLAGTDPHKKVAILAEEMGEVAHAVLEGDDANLVEELVQCAAVCTAWLESIRERGV